MVLGVITEIVARRLFTLTDSCKRRSAGSPTSFKSRSTTLEQTGGVGSIMKTLVHVVDAGYSYVRLLQGKPDVELNYELSNELPNVEIFSDPMGAEVRTFIESWSHEVEAQIVRVPQWESGRQFM